MRDRYFSLDGALDITPEMIEKIVTPEQAAQLKDLFMGLKGKVHQFIEAETRTGRVRGIIQDGVQQWHSIPYTGSTTGENRWKAPTDPKPWEGVLDTTAPREPFIQFSGGRITGIEDALTLDVYRPDSLAQHLPVLVYVHGGNNQTGDSDEISGVSFVQRHDAVVVSIDYRLGLLGFNPLSALKHGTPEENSGNFAFLDIAKALDWVRDNIASFGGDPGNITLSGFSGGARDVTAGLISSVLRGKFHKAISFSGGMTTADPTKSQIVFARALAPLAVADGKARSAEEAVTWLQQDTEEVRDYLYCLPADRVQSAIGIAWIRMEVFPHMYEDGVVLPKEGFESEDYYDVPYMLYTGAREFSLFAAYEPYFQKYINDGTFAENKEVQDQFIFLRVLGSKFYSLLNCFESLEHIARRNKSKCFGIQVDFGIDPYKVPMPLQIYGPYHGFHQALIDLDNQGAAPIVGSVFEKNGPHQMQLLFQDYMYNFMKTGDPNGEGLPEWKAWSEAENGTALHLDADDDHVITSNREHDYHYEDVMAEIKAYTGVSPEAKDYMVRHVLNGRWFSRRLDEAFDNLSEFEK